MDDFNQSISSFSFQLNQNEIVGKFSVLVPGKILVQNEIFFFIFPSFRYAWQHFNVKHFCGRFLCFSDLINYFILELVRILLHKSRFFKLWRESKTIQVDSVTFPLPLLVWYVRWLLWKWKHFVLIPSVLWHGELCRKIAKLSMQKQLSKSFNCPEGTVGPFIQSR